MSVVVQARIDEKLKSEAASVLDEMGLTMSEAFRLFLVKTAKEKTLPFDLWKPNAETRAAMKEAEMGLDEDVTLEQLQAVLDEVN